MIETKGNMGWLHHATKESVCYDLDSDAYKTAIDSGEWHRLISDVLKSEGKLEDNNTGNEGDIILDDLSDDELRALCKVERIIGYAKMKRENMIKKLSGAIL